MTTYRTHHRAEYSEEPFENRNYQTDFLNVVNHNHQNLAAELETAAGEKANAFQLSWLNNQNDSRDIIFRAFHQACWNSTPDERAQQATELANHLTNPTKKIVECFNSDEYPPTALRPVQTSDPTTFDQMIRLIGKSLDYDLTRCTTAIQQSLNDGDHERFDRTLNDIRDITFDCQYAIRDGESYFVSQHFEEELETILEARTNNLMEGYRLTILSARSELEHDNAGREHSTDHQQANNAAIQEATTRYIAHQMPGDRELIIEHIAELMATQHRPLDETTPGAPTPDYASILRDRVADAVAAIARET